MTVIRIKNDTAGDLASEILASGEIAYAQDTATLKVGDGTNNFATLSSISGGGGGGGGVTTFTGLTDTPASIGNSGESVFSNGTSNLVFESGVRSNIENTPGASGVYNIVVITQANYNSLTTKDPHTVYFIPE